MGSFTIITYFANFSPNKPTFIHISCLRETPPNFVANHAPIPPIGGIQLHFPPIYVIVYVVILPECTNPIARQSKIFLGTKDQIKLQIKMFELPEKTCDVDLLIRINPHEIIQQT